MQKLMQVLATEKAAKNGAENEFTAIFRDVQKPDLVNGFIKTYKPRNEDDEVFQPEKKLVQVRVDEQIKTLQRTLIDLFDVTATKDFANQRAVADVLVDGKPILQKVPATHLLFIEKKLVDLIGFAKKLPILDPADVWTKDGAQGLSVAEPSKTYKTKKVAKHDVVVPPTKEHPAQVRDFTEDVIAGEWTTIKQSGALTRERALTIIAQAEKLARAVKYAREEANTVEAPPVHTGAAILGFIFGQQ